MTKRIRKFAAALAAATLALTQISAVMPTVSADSLWDRLGLTMFGEQPTEETTTAAETSTAAQTSVTTETTAAASAETPAVSSTVSSTTATTVMQPPKPPKPTKPEPATTTTTTTTSITTTTTTTTAASTASTSASTASTSATAASSQTTATTGTTTAPGSNNPLAILDDPDLPDFSYLGAVGNLTEQQTQFIAKSVIKCCMDPKNSGFKEEGGRYLIKLDYDELGTMLYNTETKRSIFSVIDTVVYSYKECMFCSFPLNRTMPYRLGEDGAPSHYTGVWLGFNISDRMFGSDYYRNTYAEFDRISALADDSWTDLEKALFFHDYISTYYNYDFDTLERENGEDLEWEDPEPDDAAPDNGSAHYAYSLLNEKRGVCQAYAWLYNLLLNDNGVESYFVSADTMNHAWNLVKIDGHYYHVDTTWDDQGKNIQIQQRPKGSLSGDRQLGFAGQIEHDKFLRSTDALLSTGEYWGTSEDWITSLGGSAYDLADSAQLDTGFWHEAKTVIMPYLGGWLTRTDGEVKEKGLYQLYTREKDGDYTGTQIFVEQSPWEGEILDDQGTPIKRYKFNRSTFCMIGKVVIYTVGDGTGLQFAFCMNESNPAANMDTHRYVSGYALGLDPDKKIYGLCIEDDTLKMFTAPRFSDAPTEIDVPISDLLAGMGLQTSDELMNPSPVVGDVSGDGEMDVTDVIHMTRYLLGTKKIEDKDAFDRMDLVDDGVIDIYDLAKLKWMLIHKK